MKLRKRLAKKKIIMADDDATGGGMKIRAQSYAALGPDSTAACQWLPL